MFDKVSTIELAYQQAIDALSLVERVARSAAMFEWTRNQLSRQVKSELGPIPSNLLKLHVALRLYGREPIVRKLIEQQLANVCG